MKYLQNTIPTFLDLPGKSKKIIKTNQCEGSSSTFPKERFHVASKTRHIREKTKTD